MSTSGANARIASAICAAARRRRSAAGSRRGPGSGTSRRAPSAARLGLGVADALDVLDRLALLLPQLARLAALAVGQRDDLGGAAVLDGLGDRAAGAPDEVGRVRADDLHPAAHAPSVQIFRRRISDEIGDNLTRGLRLADGRRLRASGPQRARARARPRRRRLPRAHRAGLRRRGGSPTSSSRGGAWRPARPASG